MLATLKTTLTMESEDIVRGITPENTKPIFVSEYNGIRKPFQKKQLRGANISFMGPLFWPVQSLIDIRAMELSSRLVWRKWNTWTWAYLNNIMKGIEPSSLSSPVA